jgi:hypothetical protein
VAEGRAELVTNEQARKLLLALQGAEDTFEKAWSFLKEWSRRNGGIHDPETGKVWAAVLQEGRESVDVKALRAALGEEAVAPYLKRGQPYEVTRWVKAKKEKR